MPRYLLNRSLKGGRGLVTAEFAGGFDEAGGLFLRRQLTALLR